VIKLLSIFFTFDGSSEGEGKEANLSVIMRELLWLIVIAVAVILVIAFIWRAVAARRRGPGFDVRPLPAGHVSAYQERITELQAMFVDHPREATAGAKQLVDDMTMRMGYPTRLNDRERLRDLHSVNRTHAERYKVGLGLRQDATTEDMRRAMQAYLDLARDLLNRAETRPEMEEGGRREIAG
jgi:flagellar biosynthesis/type III secretory pathway M-ring protein FliF/YscJ